MQGVYIASSPNPVSQREFMRELRRAMGMPIGLPALDMDGRIGASLLVADRPRTRALRPLRRVASACAEENFEFQFPQLRECSEMSWPASRPPSTRG